MSSNRWRSHGREPPLTLGLRLAVQQELHLFSPRILHKNTGEEMRRPAGFAAGQRGHSAQWDLVVMNFDRLRGDKSPLRVVLAHKPAAHFLLCYQQQIAKIR